MGGKYPNTAISGKKLVLFGAGQHLENSKSCYLEWFDVSYICDNNKSKWNTELWGIPIYPPAKLLDEDRENVIVIITTSLFKDDIVSWLNENSITYTNEVLLSIPHSYLSERCNCRKLLLYGTGTTAKSVSELLLKRNFHIDYYIDSNPECTRFENRAVRSYFDIVFENPDSFFVLVANGENENYGVSRQKLMELGLTEHIDFTDYTDIPSFANTAYHYDVLLAHGRIRENIEGFEIFGDTENPKALKVVTLGGSTTESAFCYAKGWSKFLADILNTEGIPTTIYCGGIASYTSTQELLKFIRDVLPMKPDIVLSYSGFNDVNRPSLISTPDSRMNNRPFFTYFHEKFFDSVLKNIPPEKRTILYGLENKKPISEIWIDNMRTMRAIAKEFGILFLSFLQPFFFIGDYTSTESQNIIFSRRYRDVESLSYTKEGIEKLKKETALLISAAKGIDYIYDLTSIFSGYTNIYIDYCHVAELGNRIIAENIYNILKEHLNRGLAK